MIDRLIIERFKSIKHLDIACKKVNIFIGEPNSGKSNILEALGVFSQENFEKKKFNESARYKTLDDFFYDSNYNENILVKTDKYEFELFLDRNNSSGSISWFKAKYHNLASPHPRSIVNEFTITFDIEGDWSPVNEISGSSAYIDTFRAYSFTRLKAFDGSFNSFLEPPYGKNLPSLLKSNPELRGRISTILKDIGFKLLLRPIENEIFVSKEVNDDIYSYPYYSVSETIQRLIFMTLAIESNDGATITFDEPESNTFPPYTKQIAESIAVDETNQFFLTTHDPYLLMSLIEKTKVNDLNIFVTKMENYETVVSPLNEAQFSKLLDLGSDSFFNLSTILSGE